MHYVSRDNKQNTGNRKCPRGGSNHMVCSHDSPFPSAFPARPTISALFCALQGWHLHTTSLGLHVLADLQVGLDSGRDQEINGHRKGSVGAACPACHPWDLWLCVAVALQNTSPRLLHTAALLTGLREQCLFLLSLKTQWWPPLLMTISLGTHTPCWFSPTVLWTICIHPSLAPRRMLSVPFWNLNCHTLGFQDYFPWTAGEREGFPVLWWPMSLNLVTHPHWSWRGVPENRRAAWGLQAGRSSMGSGRILGKRVNGGAGWFHRACVPCELPESLWAPGKARVTPRWGDGVGGSARALCSALWAVVTEGQGRGTVEVTGGVRGSEDPMLAPSFTAANRNRSSCTRHRARLRKRQAAPGGSHAHRGDVPGDSCASEWTGGRPHWTDPQDAEDAGWRGSTTRHRRTGQDWQPVGTLAAGAAAPPMSPRSQTQPNKGSEGTMRNW